MNRRTQNKQNRINPVWGFILLILAMSVLPANAAPPTVQLTWDLPTTRVDGSPANISEITGVKVFCRTSESAPWIQNAAVTGPAKSLVAPNCLTTTYGTAHYAVKVTSSAGDSQFSAPASITWTASDPKPAIVCVVPPPNWVVQPIIGRTDRPLYSDAFVQIGRIEFGQSCEPIIVIKPGTVSKYHYATNKAGLRGLTICNQQ